MSKTIGKIKHNAKTISNFFKICVVLFIFINYTYQGIKYGRVLTSDECKGLLYIAIACFAILCPIDASIFIQNWKAIKKEEEQIIEEKIETKKEEYDL